MKWAWWRTSYRTANRVITKVFSPELDWHDARVAILWNHHARGGAFNDQASFASVFRSVHINVDTIFVGQELHLENHNLLIVPYSFVDSLKPTDYDAIVKFVQAGGNLITDQKNDLAEELGIHFSTSQLRIREHQRSRYIRMSLSPGAILSRCSKLNVENVDEVFCQDAASDAPVAIGTSVGKGKVIFFGIKFRSAHPRGIQPLSRISSTMSSGISASAPLSGDENIEAYFEPGLRANIRAPKLSSNSGCARNQQDPCFRLA